MRKHALLLLWLLGILLPVAWLVRLWPAGQRAFDWLFGPLWVHIAMHAFLFAVLAFVLAWLVGQRWAGAPAWRIALAVLGLVTVAALLQEAIQVVYKARPPVADDLLDIGVDLAGGAWGMAAYVWRVHRPR